MSIWNPGFVKELADGTREQTSVVSELFAGRTLFLDGEVTQESCSALVASLLVLESLDAEAPVTLVVSSPGGDVNAGLGLIDVMGDLSCPVNTVGVGLVASMASIVLACGDHRSAYPHCEIMVHQLMTGTGMAQQTDIDIVAAHAARMRSSLDDLLAAHSRMTPQEARALTERDCWLTPERALELGLIDEIIEKRPRNY